MIIEEETIEVEEKDKGFTLVELLIVIVILGILATIVVFAVRGITDKGQKSACAADSKTLQVAAEAYFATYPGATLPSLNVAVADGGTGTADPENALVAAGLIREVSANYNVDANGDVDGVGGCN